MPPNWQYTAVDAGSDDGSWWADDFIGVDASIARIESAVVEQQAAGIIGHEQGGTLAAIIAARSVLGMGVPLKFAVVCGAEMPSAGPYSEAFFHRLREGEATPMPTLHCISKPDSSCAEELAACFAPSAEILWHDCGSAMPGPSWWEETQARMLVEEKLDPPHTPPSHLPLPHPTPPYVRVTPSVSRVAWHGSRKPAGPSRTRGDAEGTCSRRL